MIDVPAQPARIAPASAEGSDPRYLAAGFDESAGGLDFRPHRASREGKPSQLASDRLTASQLQFSGPTTAGSPPKCTIAASNEIRVRVDDSATRSSVSPSSGLPRDSGRP